MARGNTLPKDPERRQRRNPSPEVVDIGGAPSSPPEMPRGDWRAETFAWWETWSTAPQASQFGPTQWQRLAMLVPLVDRYFEEPSTGTMSEIRLNESLLGATSADLLRLRWRYGGEPPAASGPAPKAKKGKDPREAHLRSVS